MDRLTTDDDITHLISGIAGSQVILKREYLFLLGLKCDGTKMHQLL